MSKNFATGSKDYHRLAASRLTEKQLNSLIFQPWFVPDSTFHMIAALLPREYMFKMREYFDTYGCMVCKRRDRLYAQNGMCGRCLVQIGSRLRRCWKKRLRRLDAQKPNQLVGEIVSNAKAARNLLKDLAPLAKPAKREKVIRTNPVADLVCFASHMNKMRRRPQTDFSDH